MIQTVASVSLPVDETLAIKKSRFCPPDGGNGKRICIVTGFMSRSKPGMPRVMESMPRGFMAG